MRHIRDYRKADPSTYYYRVFCMYRQMNFQDDCDAEWQRAEEMYQAFYNSKEYFMDVSEIDAMNEYLKRVNHE